MGTLDVENVYSWKEQIATNLPVLELLDSVRISKETRWDI